MVPYDPSSEGPLGGLSTDVAGAAEKDGLLVGGSVNRLGDGEVAMDRGVSTRRDHREEGTGDDEIVDPSCEDDRVGTNCGEPDWRTGRGISTTGDPVCSRCVMGAPSRHDSAVAKVVVLELTGVLACPAPPFEAGMECFASSADHTC